MTYGERLITIAKVLEVYVNNSHQYLSLYEAERRDEAVEDVIVAICEALPILSNFAMRVLVSDSKSRFSWKHRYECDWILQMKGARDGDIARMYSVCIKRAAMFTFISWFMGRLRIPHEILLDSYMEEAFRACNVAGLFLMATHEYCRERLLRKRYELLYTAARYKHPREVERIKKQLFYEHTGCATGKEFEHLCYYVQKSAEVLDMESMDAVMTADPTTRMTDIQYMEDTDFCKVTIESGRMRAYVTFGGVSMCEGGLFDWMESKGIFTKGCLYDILGKIMAFDELERERELCGFSRICRFKPRGITILIVKRLHCEQ